MADKFNDENKPVNLGKSFAKEDENEIITNLPANSLFIGDRVIPNAPMFKKAEAVVPPVKQPEGDPRDLGDGTLIYPNGVRTTKDGKIISIK